MPDYSKKIVYLSQAQYHELIANGTITVNGVTVTYNENDIYVTPQDEPITDVKINNVSIGSNGVANIPIGSNNNFGVYKVGGYGITAMAAAMGPEYEGVLATSNANNSEVKTGTNGFKPITPNRLNTAVFYGLSKAAGADLNNTENVTVGTYPDASKAAIQHMLGIDDLVAPNENTLTASKAYAINDVFTANGKLYKATAAIAQDAAIVPAAAGETVVGANCEEIKIGDYFAQKRDTVLETTLSLGRVEDSIVGTNSVALGANVLAVGDKSIALGSTNGVYGQGSFAIGTGTNAVGDYSAAEGYMTLVSGSSAHVEGMGYRAPVYLTGEANATSYAYTGTITINNINDYIVDHKGFIAKITNVNETNNTVTLNKSFIESIESKQFFLIVDRASGTGSHSEGGLTKAISNYAHAEGYKTTVSGTNAHAEGMNTTSSGYCAHAEGFQTIASGSLSHAEGNITIASGTYSHAEGLNTFASGTAQHVSGKYNVEDDFNDRDEWIANTLYSVGDKVKVTTTNNNITTVQAYVCKTANNDSVFTASNWNKDNYKKFVHIIGNGTADNARANAYALDWSGNGKYAGDVYVGCNSDSTGGTKVATLNDIPSYATDSDTQSIISGYNEQEVSA